MFSAIKCILGQVELCARPVAVLRHNHNLGLQFRPLATQKLRVVDKERAHGGVVSVKTHANIPHEPQQVAKRLDEQYK